MVLVMSLFSMGTSSSKPRLSIRFCIALTAEDAHQVIFQAEEEAGSTGVALTAGTAAQLVVDTAALVALGTDDEQAAGLRAQQQPRA